MNVQVNETGRGCGPCRTDAYVTLNNGGRIMGGASGRAVTGMSANLYTLNVDHPAEVARLIKAVKAHYYGESNMLMGMGALMMRQPGMMPLAAMLQQQQQQQPQPQPAAAAAEAGPVEVRAFVSLASQPHAPPQIVMVNPAGADIAVVIRAVAAKLHVPYSRELWLELAGLGSSVTSPHEIAANDKLVLMGGGAGDSSNATAPPAYAEKPAASSESHI